MRSPLTRDQRDKLRSEVFHRLLTVDTRAANADARTVPASMSSETPVKRWFGNEILTHTPEALNLGRANDGKLPMLFGHDTDVLIGAAEEFKIADKRLSGTLRFAQNTRAPEVWEQIRENMPLGISIGYRIDEWKESADTDDVVVTRWTLHEVSVVTVPADASVGINRSLKEPPMDEPTPTPQPAAIATSIPANLRLVHDRALAEGMQAERNRIAEVRNLFLLPGFQSEEYLELERQAIDGGMTVEQTREQILILAGSGISPVASLPVRQTQYVPSLSGPAERQPVQGYARPVAPHVSAGRDNRDGYQEGAMLAISIRAGLVTDKAVVDKERGGNEFMGMTLVELARESLARQGINTRGMSPMQAAGLAFTTPGSFVRGTIAHGASDFANILLDAANKSMLTGWTENDETFQVWTRSMSMSDFKTHNLVNLSNFGDLDVVPEHAEYKYGTFSDVKETIALRTYGKLFNMTRQAIINDDLSAFTAIPMKMGRAAARMVGDEAYAVLTGNPTLNQDSTALFHSNHGNYFSTTGAGAPSVTTLDHHFAAMATRTDPSGATLNLEPSFILVPHALKGTANALANDQFDPLATAGTMKTNQYRGRLTVVADARLDTFNAAGWFLAANPSRIGTVVVGYLNGQSAPYLEQENAFTQDGVAMKVRLDCRAAAEDFRGLIYDDGAP